MLPTKLIAKQFVAIFFFQRFCYLSLGAHVDLSGPNFEIHVPFGFFRVGWVRQETYLKPTKVEEVNAEIESRTYGYQGEWKNV